MPFLCNAWYCAAWTEEVTRTPIARRILNQPVLMFRMTTGAIAAMSNACVHRFAPLHQGVLAGDVISCPYHGLSYNSAGVCVHNPHGDGQIPRGAKLRSYPIVEKQRVVWIWMGDPGRADAAPIPDLEVIAGDPRPMLTGYLRMPVDYRLVLDNLLDLTHAAYIHRGTFSSAGRTTREYEFEANGDYVKATYVDRAIETPPSQQPFFDKPVGDYHTYIDFVRPGLFHNVIAMTDVGAPFDSGSLMRSGHIITPETDTSTHYFWYSSRNRRVGDPETDARLRAVVNKAFTSEDEPMIAACQENMGGSGDLRRLRPISLASDEAALRARRILELHIEAELNSAAGR
jgi:phenylpropionate dioxygenase-like ring-hydroxylating dioxygenase large terminal subunit